MAGWGGGGPTLAPLTSHTGGQLAKALHPSPSTLPSHVHRVTHGLHSPQPPLPLQPTSIPPTLLLAQQFVCSFRKGPRPCFHSFQALTGRTTPTTTHLAHPGRAPTCHDQLARSSHDIGKTRHRRVMF